MKLEFVSLLRVQRGLYDIPRGPERFHAYLQAMIDPETRDLRLPFAALNPMGKSHVPAFLDKLIALEVEQAAANTVEVAAARLTDSPGTFRVALVVSDDAAGGWTHRTASDFSHRFEDDALRKRGWITGILWTGDEASLEAVRDEVLNVVIRSDYIQRHGPARTLREMMGQEGRVLAAAGSPHPILAADEICAAREVIRPHLDSRERPIIIACLYGDDAAIALGYIPLGLGANAGFAVARHDAPNPVQVQA